MAKAKFDGVVEAVHYNPEGRVDWVRAYLRRGSIFTDRVLLDRQTLVEHLRAGKKYLVGERIPLLGGTFDVSKPVRLFQKNGEEILVVDEIHADQDRLEGVPVI